ncbi:hypothetical protein [Streptosporangium sp. NPDC002721]|uniref:hypothetical protein n=1 Tax=Streptosporangium sp. NPDC002721 TaxID=3366188 RepID=UPI0036AAC92B
MQTSPPPLSAPRPAVFFPRAGGVDIVPSTLPIHVSDADRLLTVAEFFGLNES